MQVIKKNFIGGQHCTIKRGAVHLKMTKLGIGKSSHKTNQSKGPNAIGRKAQSQLYPFFFSIEPQLSGIVEFPDKLSDGFHSEEVRKGQTSWPQVSQSQGLETSGCIFKKMLGQIASYRAAIFLILHYDLAQSLFSPIVRSNISSMITDHYLVLQSQELP